MIEINLVRTKTIGGQAAISSMASAHNTNEIVALLLRMILLCAIPLGLYFYEDKIITEKNTQLQEKNNQLTAVTGQVSKYGAAEQVVKQLHDEKGKLSSQIDVIKKISGKRSKKLKFLKSIQNNIPETVWIRKIEFKDEQIEITGRATTTDSMQEFVNTLNTGGVAKDVVNEGFNKVKVGQVDVYEFKLHAAVL